MGECENMKITENLLTGILVVELIQLAITVAYLV